MSAQKKYAAIHILVKKAGLSRSDYEAMLFGFGVESSKHLNEEQQAELIAKLREIAEPEGEKPKYVHGWGKEKYQNFGHRPGMASPREMRMIEAMWRDIARDKSDTALGNFLARQTETENSIGVKSVIWLKTEHVKPVLVALKMMKRQNKKEGE